MGGKSSQQDRTRKALIAGLAAELVRPGRLTAERVALRAGVNKALLYRYFGGLSGLIIAFAESDDFMPSAAELRALLPADIGTRSARERFVACLQAYIRALAGRPATVQILLRLHLLDDEVIAALQAGRARAIAEIRTILGAADATFRVDVELSFTLLVGGISQILGHRRDSWTAGERDRDELAQRLSETVAALLCPRPDAPAA